MGPWESVGTFLSYIGYVSNLTIVTLLLNFWDCLTHQILLDGKEFVVLSISVGNKYNF